MDNLAFFKSRQGKLYLFLCFIFLTNAILAEIIGVKIFSLENTLIQILPKFICHLILYWISTSRQVWSFGQSCLLRPI